jgi:hypothetical protein
MNTNLENRLRKLEDTAGSRIGRLVVIGADTREEERRQADEMVRAGDIQDGDLVIFTGVPRSRDSVM